MALPEFSMRQLLEAGVHFGHQTHRWDPKMKSFIFGDRNGIHIIDLSQTVPLLHHALVKIRDIVAGGGRVLFVGTKRQAQAPIAEAAQRCAQYFMNVRWLGGTLTNWETISASIRRLKDLEERLEVGASGFTKKELLDLTRQRDKLNASLGGIREMGGLPDIMFVIDVNKESIAIKEAKKLGIPVVAIVDTNCCPDSVDYIIPGNDDASRAITLYCSLIADAVIDGIGEAQTAAGVDLGEMEAAPKEPAIGEDEAPADAPAPDQAAGDGAGAGDALASSQEGESAADAPAAQLSL